jgi:hypothetical protein
VQAAGTAKARWQPRYELFDIGADPFEQKDLAAAKPDEVAKLKREYETWFADVTRKGFTPPRISIGNEKENPVRLSRQDWRGPKAGWTAESEGYWEVKFERSGRYEVTIRSRTEFTEHDLAVDYLGRSIGADTRLTSSGRQKPTSRAEASVLDIEAGEARIRATVRHDQKTRGADYVEVKYLGPVAKK